MLGGRGHLKYVTLISHNLRVFEYDRGGGAKFITHRMIRSNNMFLLLKL